MGLVGREVQILGEPPIIAELAQLVEQRTRNAKVRSSILLFGTKCIGGQSALVRLERSWRNSVEGLRIQCHRSPIGRGGRFRTYSVSVRIRPVVPIFDCGWQVRYLARAHNPGLKSVQFRHSARIYRRVDWSWFQPGLITRSTGVRIPPLLHLGCWTDLILTRSEKSVRFRHEVPIIARVVLWESN